MHLYVDSPKKTFGGHWNPESITANIYWLIHYTSHLWAIQAEFFISFKDDSCKIYMDESVKDFHNLEQAVNHLFISDWYG